MEVESFLIDNVYFLVEGHTLALMRGQKAKALSLRMLSSQLELRKDV